MKKILILIPLFLLLISAKSQTSVDSTTVVNSNGDTIRYTTTYKFSNYVSGDSLLGRSTFNKGRVYVSPIDLPVSTAAQTALNLKASIATTDSMRANIYAGLNSKQPTLVSATNIKTINGASVLGSGDLVVVGGANTATVGVANCPTASGTQTITHSLGRTPIIIEIYGVGRFTSNAAATPTPFSSGTWTSLSGNSCVYMPTIGTTTLDGASSTTFSVFMATSSGNTMSGVIGNVGSVSFDIVWSETGTAAALPFRWKAQ